MRSVQRQAFAGLLWSKQFYHYDVPRWLDGDPAGTAAAAGSAERPQRATGAISTASDVFSMPDKWEYPWFAAWDLAFPRDRARAHRPRLRQTPAAAAHARMVSCSPTAQLPAYEWAFGDVNPPVHAWAAMRVYQDRAKDVRPRRPARSSNAMFQKLLLNFTWWVNRKDARGQQCLPRRLSGPGQHRRLRPQRTAARPAARSNNPTARAGWACTRSNLLTIALELGASTTRSTKTFATKFFEHFLRIADAMNDIGTASRGLWNETAGFYYDVLKLPDGRALPIAG